MSKIKISVVICTYNRAELLRGAIQSVLGQEYPVKDYELIIVDNNSTDFTHIVVEEFLSQYAHVRYILETNVGLSHARNRGWQEARGEYVGYLDDDAKASLGWLSAAEDVARNIHPEAFGGPFYAFYNSTKPVWFKDEYGSHVQGDVARPLLNHEYLDGGNMFIRRELLSCHGGFHIDLGMKGTKIAYGEETHFFKQLRADDKNSVLFYDPAIYIYHLVRKDKMNLWAVPKRFYFSGVYSARVNNLQKQNRAGLVFQILNISIRVFLFFFRGLVVRDKAKYPYFENYLYESLFFNFLELGSLFERFRISSEIE